MNAALYDRPGHMSLADDEAQEIPLPRCDGTVDYDHVGNAAALAFQSCAPDAPTAVEAHTIDQLELDDLGFLKVDAQGSDLLVLRGARATIERCRPVITAECERDLSALHGSTADDYHRFFNEVGYQVETLDIRSDGKQLDLIAKPG
jgi:FkbM family methyltransferase